MSVDYTYTHGYGFFIHRENLDNAGGKESLSLYEDVFEFLPSANLNLLAVASASSAMMGETDKVFIAVARSLVTGDAKLPDHTGAEPAGYEGMEDFATSEELHELDIFASMCQMADSVFPKIHFYITID